MSTPSAIAIAVITALVIVIGVVVVRRRRQLPPSPPRPQIEEGSRDESASTPVTSAPPTSEQPEPEQLAPEQSTLEQSATQQPVIDQPVPEQPILEQPESGAGRMERLRARLAGSGKLGNALMSIFSRTELAPADWEELEDTLIMADLGIDATDEIMSNLRTAAKVKGTSDPVVVRELLRDELLRVVDPTLDRTLRIDPEHDGEHAHPRVIMMVGVNGTGKTTTIGKLARLLVAEGKSVVLGAADTFRAAAADQLQTWGERVGVHTVKPEREGAEPASVAFEAGVYGQNEGADVVLVDTAGRLQNNTTLMDELGKIKRVINKREPISETLLVIDATTGQNGLRQAEVFAQVVDVTGVVLTKLDGSAKGGIVVSVQRALGVPVKFVGLGEGADDLAPFNPHDFVDAIVGTTGA